MAVPLLDLKAQNLALEGELTGAFTRVLRSGHYILGTEVENLERNLAAYLGVGHAITLSSGTDAILVALMALGIGPGDEVICPSFTFFATAGCVARMGAKPVFADSCPVCFNLDVADVSRRISPRTKAVIPVHLFGQSVEMDPLLAMAQKHGLAVIEDAAQAFGARHRERFVGTAGTFGTFSFFPSKNLGCLGDGGLLVTNDDSLAERAVLLRNHGARPKYHHRFIGGNFRMDALQAALLSVKLPHLEIYSKARRTHAEYYGQRLGRIPGVESARAAECICCSPDAGKSKANRDVARLLLPVALGHNEHIWNQYTVRAPGKEQRDRLRDFLTTRGIGSEIYYPVPMHKQECFANPENAALRLPVAEHLAETCFSIPVFPELTRSQQDEVIDGIEAFLTN
jgi:dTDP-4-amino-4,6-dideoxygalactose transaminase